MDNSSSFIVRSATDGQQQQCVPQTDNNSSFIVDLPAGQQQQFYCEVCHRWTTAAVCARRTITAASLSKDAYTFVLPLPNLPGHLENLVNKYSGHIPRGRSVLRALVRTAK